MCALAFFAVCICAARGSAEFDVRAFGAKGDGETKGEVFRIERADAVSFHNCKFNGVQGADARRLFSVRDAATINF